MSVDELLDAVARNAALPDELAEATPPQVYSSAAFLELELDEIFNHEWVCVGRADEFEAPGDYRATTIGRDPVLVLRDRAGVLRAMSNVCRHRMATLVAGTGRIKGRISCPYHAWTYDLDGQLIGAAHMRDNFNKWSVCLPQFQVEIWQGWVYVSLDPEAPPLGPRLTALSKRLENYQLARYRTLFRVEEIWDTNWKILVQNFTEGYHLFVAHAQTIEPAMPTRLAHAMHGGAAYSLYEQGRVPGQSYERASDMQVDNPLLTDDERAKAVLSAVFPAHVFSVVAERMFWLSLQPYGTGKVKVFWGVDTYPGAVPEDPDARAAYAAELKAGFDRINEEDKPIIGTIAQNAKALAAVPGRLSPKERTVWSFQKYLARQLCKDRTAKATSG
ncbi:Rieske 2Fe-2S domain-containing protein [Aestuariivita sp.]|jgi:phenylpropionate dioxygenase-like ring-hydroxylating dioxygenase large terminal subunit|uniref:aromatic ring-hydroxylating oxygenase subunit alpha n=1 Tax=Aestuariivita sp. TaxID=1872407 RepID=UPI002172A120|nr:Rieske 2Fe-2S domain-containing protein [Aestuariivita sp.]MCE8006093.1 Rieske 2Fe-2S domain-containing protein [Aestuariivita sp.]